MRVKKFSTASSNSSSQIVQAMVNYRLNENVEEFMSADELLKSQTETMGLQITDIIEFKTENFNHWGIYIGCDLVAQRTDGFIRQALLRDVANGKKCRVNNKVQSAKQRNLNAKQQKEVYMTVMRELDSAVDQDSIQFNSEHQVTKWKYRTPFSDTVDTIVRDGGKVVGAVIGGTVGMATAGPVGAVEGAVVGYDTGDRVAELVTKAVQK